MQRIEEIARQTPGVKHTVAIAGQSILLNANAPNFGAMYVMLDDFHERLTPRPVRRRASPPGCRASLQDEISDGLVNVFGAPPLDGLGTAGGFKIMIEDRGDTGLESLASGRRRHRGRRRQDAGAARICSPASAPTRPGCTSTSTARQAKTMGVSMAEVFNTLQVYLGSLYVNDFNRFGRTWQVNVQADAELPQADRGPQAAQDPQRPRQDGAARHAGHGRATSAARC